MTLIAEATIGSLLFREALSAAPGVELVVEDITRDRDERMRIICWVKGEGLESFEAGLASDPTVRSYRRLVDSDGAMMYRLTLSEFAQSRSTYDVAVEQDIVLVDLRYTASGVQALGRVPDREALVAYRRACEEAGIEFQLERLYSEEERPDRAGIDERFGVTARQREALRTALEMGYFEIPREASLEDVAEELDITQQALSNRLRRGHTNLLRNTVS